MYEWAVRTKEHGSLIEVEFAQSFDVKLGGGRFKTLENVWIMAVYPTGSLNFQKVRMEHGTAIGITSLANCSFDRKVLENLEEAVDQIAKSTGVPKEKVKEGMGYAGLLPKEEKASSSSAALPPPALAAE